MRQQSDRPTHSWDGIAQEIMHETNPKKLHMLATQLNDAMLAEERDRVRQRFKFLSDAKANRGYADFAGVEVCQTKFQP